MFHIKRGVRETGLHNSQTFPQCTFIADRKKKKNPISKLYTRASPPRSPSQTRAGPVNSLYLSVCVDIVRYFLASRGAWTSGTSSCWLFLGPNPPFFVQYPDVRYLYDTLFFLGFVILLFIFFLKMCFFVLSLGRINCGPLRCPLKVKRRCCPDWE